MKSECTADSQEVLEYMTSVMRGNETEEILIGVGEGMQSTIQKKSEPKRDSKQMNYSVSDLLCSQTKQKWLCLKFLHLWMTLMVIQMTVKQVSD